MRDPLVRLVVIGWIAALPIGLRLLAPAGSSWAAVAWTEAVLACGLAVAWQARRRLLAPPSVVAPRPLPTRAAQPRPARVA